MTFKRTHEHLQYTETGPHFADNTVLDRTAMLSSTDGECGSSTPLFLSSPF